MLVVFAQPFVESGLPTSFREEIGGFIIIVCVCGYDGILTGMDCDLLLGRKKCVYACVYMCMFVCEMDEVVKKCNDTLQWSREQQKCSLIDNRIIKYSVIMLLHVYLHAHLKF